MGAGADVSVGGEKVGENFVDVSGSGDASAPGAAAESTGLTGVVVIGFAPASGRKRHCGRQTPRGPGAGS